MSKHAWVAGTVRHAHICGVVLVTRTAVGYTSVVSQIAVLAIGAHLYAEHSADVSKCTIGAR